MRILLDTHLLLWLAYEPALLSRRAKRLLADANNTYLFSVVSVWETAIKQGLGRSGFHADAAMLRDGMLAGGMEELTVLSSHAIAVGSLPLLHRDPFDRLMVAQSMVENLVFATVDSVLTDYSPLVKYVG